MEHRKVCPAADALTKVVFYL